MADTLLNFKSIDWDIEYYSDVDEAYIMGITVAGGNELIDDFTEKFIVEINQAFIKQIKADGLRFLEEDAGQKALEDGNYNYG